MMAEWIAKGAGIGIEIFFALITFALCLGVIAGVIALIGALFGAADKDKL